jgi:hypothetical protein
MGTNCEIFILNALKLLEKKVLRKMCSPKRIR